MKLNFGDLISVYFDSDTCWGKEGYHTGIVLHDDDVTKLQIHWLDEDMVYTRKISSYKPSIEDDIEYFLKYWEDGVVIIGNLASNLIGGQK